MLEPRILLSAGSLPPEPLAPVESPLGTSAVLVDLDPAQKNQSDESPALLTYFVSPDGVDDSQAKLDEPRAGTTTAPADPTAPTLPGLELIDPDPAPLVGQIIYLDFNGAKDVIYHGPVTVGPFDVPVFQAPGKLAGQEQAVILQTLAELQEIFAGSGVAFTTRKPSASQPYSTIYIGGDNAAFAPYGSFLGLAEQVDVGNTHQSDRAVVFPAAASLWAPGQNDGAITQLIAHEAGHLLGYSHAGLPELLCRPQDRLAEVAALYTLTVTADNGSVTVNPIENAYHDGDIVELIPKPDTGYSFAGWSGDVHSKSLALNLTMDGNKTVTADFSPWTAPLGIPMPDFGILETPRMYEGKTYDFGSGPEPYKDAGNGPYTHYIDNTDPNATDTSNPYGTAGTPRKTVPGDLPAGSVVEVHGGPYTYGTLSGSHYWTWFSGTGTAANPIFIRGVGLQIPRFDTMNIRVGGSYLVIENLDLNDSTIGLHHSRASDHISMRSLEVHGGPVSYGTAVGVGQGTYVVVYNNYIHNNGDPNAADENDFHAVSAGYRDGRHAEHVWIVDNHMHGNGGDSVQINSGNVALADVARYIYIGRNIMHEEGENAVDLKQCADVVVSQNLMYKFRPTQFAYSGSDGTPMVVNGDLPKENIWILFNEIADSSNAIRSEESSYIVGNKIYDILGNPEGGGGYGILTWPASTLYILGNTMENVRRGISHQGGGTGKAVYLHDNILALAASGEFHLGLTAAVAANSSVSHNVFDSSSGQAIINWNGTATQWNLSQFQQATGQGQGCLEGDPHFTSRPTKDFHLQPTSPAIDAGISSGPVQDVLDRFQAWYGIDIRKDIETRAKTQGSAWDIGAYEYVLSASTDLTVAGVSQNSLTLTWTVPAEQGISGTPTGYDIRYASSPITEANWAAATQVQSEPTADAFGQPQSFTITGLGPGHTYYLAIKTRDEMGHVSPLSNVVSATTTAPEITVLGQTLSIADGDTTPSLTDATDFGKVAVGGTAITRTFTVRNDGGGTLTLSAVVVPTGFSLVEGLATSLAPGASNTFTVRLDTAVAGTKTGDIVFTSNDPNESPYNFRITGVVGPEITVLGQGLSIVDGDTSPRLTDGTDFGEVAAGGTAISRTFTVRNDGGGTLTLGAVVVPTGFTLVEGLATSLAPGASNTFTVRLDTAVAGTKTGDIVFTSNDPNESPYNFRITGAIVGLEITVLGQGLSIADGDTSPRLTDGTDFGEVAVGGTAISSRTFTVRNDGGGTLTLGAVVVPTGFTLVEGLATSLAPGASNTFTVQLDTAVAGTKTGDIVFTSNDPNESPYNFRIRGVVGPEITMLGQGLSIVDGDTSPRLTDGTDFGEVAVGGTALTRTFTVRNDGGGTLTLGAVVVPTGFTLINGLVTSLAPGASDTFTVRLNTAVAGTKTGDIVFTSNDPSESPYNFRIRGVVGPEITMLGQGLSIVDGDTSPRLTDGTDFGEVAVGGTAITRTFTVRNDGGGTLTLGTVVVPTGFTLINGLVTSLAPGASDTFTVRLNTAVAGTKIGDIVFTSNDPDEDLYQFRITGTVV